MRPIGLRKRAPTKERRLRSVQALKRTGTRLTDHESASTKDVTSTAPGAPRTSIEPGFCSKVGAKVVPAEGLWADRSDGACVKHDGMQ